MATIYIYLEDIVSNPIAVRQVTFETTGSNPIISGDYIVVADEVAKWTNDNGIITASNVVAGFYKVEIDSPYEPTSFTILVPDNSSAYNIKDLISPFTQSLVVGGVFNITSSNSVFASESTTVYGELYTHDGTLSASIVEGTTYTPVTSSWTTGLTSSGITVPTSGSILISTAGVYAVNINVSFRVGTPECITYGAIFVNGVEQHNLRFAQKNSSSDIGSAGTAGFINVPTTASVDFRLRHDLEAFAQFVIEYANFSVRRIGPAV